MNPYLQNQWNEFKESPTYTIVAERFAGLDPRARKWIQFGFLALFALFMLLIPMYFYDDFAESKADVENYVKAKHMLQEFAQFNDELSIALNNIRSNFKLIGATSIQNTISQFVQNAQLPLEALKEFKENPIDQEVMTLITASFKLDQINYRHLMEFLNQVEDQKNGIIVKSLVITQDEKLDGYLNLQMDVEAYSLKGI